MEPIYVQKVFTKKQCESIILFHSDWTEKIGGIEEGTIDPYIRQCITYTPPSIEHIPNWFESKISKKITFVNERVYNFDLGRKGKIELVLLRYDSGGHYEEHIDIGSSKSKRKISFSLLLNDSYEGGKLKFIGLEEITESILETGDMILFPSYYPHKVESVTSGVRWVIVGWYSGDKHFI